MGATPPRNGAPAGAWWAAFLGFRRVAVFLLGVIVVLDGLTSRDHAVPELIIGAMMIGVLPLENVVEAYSAAVRPRRHAEDA